MDDLRTLRRLLVLVAVGSILGAVLSVVVAAARLTGEERAALLRPVQHGEYRLVRWTIAAADLWLELTVRPCFYGPEVEVVLRAASDAGEVERHEVTLWTRYGEVTRWTDADGSVTFRNVRRHSRKSVEWPLPSFRMVIVMRPKYRGNVCPPYWHGPLSFESQRVSIELPAYATVEVDAGALPPHEPGKARLVYDTLPYEGGFLGGTGPYWKWRMCVLAEQPFDATLEVDDHEWFVETAVVVAPDTVTVLPKSTGARREP
jgi:hypothetical protein